MQHDLIVICTPVLPSTYALLSSNPLVKKENHIPPVSQGEGQTQRREVTYTRSWCTTRSWCREEGPSWAQPPPTLSIQVYLDAS